MIGVMGKSPRGVSAKEIGFQGRIGESRQEPPLKAGTNIAYGMKFLADPAGAHTLI